MAIDWTRGYECIWRFSPVDAITWASTGSLANVTAASYTSSASAEAVETAALTSMTPYRGDRHSGWLRIEGLVTQGTSRELVRIGTLRFEQESSSWAGGMRTDTLRGVSSLYPASEAESLADGAWAAKNSDGASQAAAYIAACTPAPVIVHGSFKLPDTVVFDLDSTPLEAAWAMLDSGGWVARQDGLGQIHVMEMPTEPSAAFGTAERGIFLSTASSDSEGRITYKRAWGPGLRVWDAFDANLPEIGLVGSYRVTGQRVTCGASIAVEETVEVIE